MARGGVHHHHYHYDVDFDIRICSRIQGTGNQRMRLAKAAMDNTDHESLLAERQPSAVDSSQSFLKFYPSRSKKNILLLAISFSIAICLTVYIYLNVIAIDGNQTDPNSRYKPLSRRKPMLDHESIFSDSGPSMIKLSDLLAHCIVALHVAGQEVVNSSLAKRDKIEHIGSKGKTLEGVDDVVTSADIKSHKMIVSTIKDSYRRLKVVSEEDTSQGFENMSADEDLLPLDRTEFARMLRNNLNYIEGQHPDRGSLIAQHETFVWIDPLDATKEYSENLTDYVTLMACIVHKSIPIAGVILKPFTNQTYWSMFDGPTGKYYHSPDLSKLLIDLPSKPHEQQVIRAIVSRSHAGDVEQLLENIYGPRADITSAGGSGYKTIELLNRNADLYIHLTRIKKWDICAPHAILHSISGGNLTDLNGDKIRFGNPKEKVVESGLVATLDQRIHSDLMKLTKKLHQTSN